jgi:hypothetical protein
MSTTPTLTSNEPRATTSAKSRPGRLFYAGAAALILVLMFLGFQRYYLRGQAFPEREIPPPMRTLILLHATAMTAWVVLFMIQSLLVVNRGYRVHMALGRVGAVLAAGMVVLGLIVGIISARNTPAEARIWTLTPKQFLSVPLITIVLFGLCVAVAVWYRRRPDVHRPMMLTATLVAIPAAVSRIGPLSDLYTGTVWETVVGPFLWTLVLATALLVTKCVLTRSFDRWLAVGYAVLVASSLLIMQLARTTAWDWFAGLLL